MKENFVVSFEKNHVAQANLVKAENGKQARDYFSYQNPKAHIYGVRIDMVGYARRGMPVVEVPDGWEPGRKHFANSSYHKETYLRITKISLCRSR